MTLLPKPGYHIQQTFGDNAGSRKRSRILHARFPRIYTPNIPSLFKRKIHQSDVKYLAPVILSSALSHGCRSSVYSKISFAKSSSLILSRSM